MICVFSFRMTYMYTCIYVGCWILLFLNKYYWWRCSSSRTIKTLMPCTCFQWCLIFPGKTMGQIGRLLLPCCFCFKHIIISYGKHLFTDLFWCRDNIVWKVLYRRHFLDDKTINCYCALMVSPCSKSFTFLNHWF